MMPNFHDNLVVIEFAKKCNFQKAYSSPLFICKLISFVYSFYSTVRKQRYKKLNSLSCSPATKIQGLCDCRVTLWWL